MREVTIDELIRLLESHFINEQIDVIVTERDVLSEANAEFIRKWMEENNIKLISND